MCNSLIDNPEFPGYVASWIRARSRRYSCCRRIGFWLIIIYGFASNLHWCCQFKIVTVITRLEMPKWQLQTESHYVMLVLHFVDVLQKCVHRKEPELSNQVYCIVMQSKMNYGKAVSFYVCSTVRYQMQLKTSLFLHALHNSAK